MAEHAPTPLWAGRVLTEDAPPTVAAAQKLLTEPWVITCISLLFTVSLTSLIVAAIIVRRRARAAWGPYGDIVELVFAGHAYVQKEDKEAAANEYRMAVLSLCRKILSPPEGQDGNSGGTFVSPAPATVASEVDEALRSYNASVSLGATIAVAMSNEALADADTLLPVVIQNSDQGLGATLDKARCIESIDDPDGPAARARCIVGDRLAQVNGKDVATMTMEQIEGHLKVPCRLSFRRPTAASSGDETGQPQHGRDAVVPGSSVDEGTVFVCCRCGSSNRFMDDKCFFRCFSCQSTVVLWNFLVSEPATTRDDQKPGTRRWKKDRVNPDVSFEHLKDLTWESSGLDKVVRHPTGFGVAEVPPSDCRHHEQVGATCGMAAVNNLITNNGFDSVDSQYMQGVSARLGEAEAALREGEQCVQEGGEEQNLAELYASAAGGHFDVQTLQTVLSEYGLHMWYVQAKQLQTLIAPFLDGVKPKGGNAAGSDAGEKDEIDGVVGYIVHRRDPTNPRSDHWFVVREHKAEPTPKLLLQDSLFEQVFSLTKVETTQLLLHLPAGSLFAVSRLSASTAAEP